MMNNEEDVLDTIASVQDGEYEAVREVLAKRILSVNVRGADQCTLLHWAAVNNRVRIASLLIEFGAEHLPGGVLQETPLQWALRKRYYRMMTLLMDKMHVDLRHRSAQGLDALHLACRLGDVNAFFLLLSRGANPNSLDGEGDTPLLHLVRANHCGAEARDAAVLLRSADMVRMLLMFGADVTAGDAQHRNSALHLLAMGKRPDLSLAFSLYSAAPKSLPSLQNADGLVPYSLAVQSENRVMARFLFDALIFHYFPYHTPTVLYALLVISLLWLLSALPLFSALLIWSALYLALTWTLLQQQIVDHRSRASVGLFFGALLSLLWSALTFAFPRVSLGMHVLCLACLCPTLYFGWRVMHTRPQCAKAESKSELSHKVEGCAPSEGTDEENAEEIGAAAGEASKGDHVIVKDAFTGKIEIVRPQRESGDAPPTARTLGPKICGACLCDKRSFNGDAISLATHCATCGLCVVDQDHHSVFLGTCVGKGNRREFVFFLIFAALSNLFYFSMMKYIQYYELVPQDLKFNIVSRVIRAEWALLVQFPHLFLLTWFFGFVAGVLLGFMAQGQLMFVARETTLTNVIKRRYASKSPTQKKQWKSLLLFLRTGQYTVAYPKHDPEKTAKSCCGGHSCESSAAPASTSSKNHIESLFSRIETEIGGKELFSKEQSSLSLSLNDTAIKSAHSIHTEQPLSEDEKKKKTDAQQRRDREQAAHSHDHEHAHYHSDDDLLDDYDREFADSSYNRYYDRYGEDDDDDDDSPSNNSFYNQQDDEESLLKSRKV